MTKTKKTSVTFSSTPTSTRRRTTVPKDVCETLGIKNTGDKILWHIDDDFKGTVLVTHYIPS